MESISQHQLSEFFRGKQEKEIFLKLNEKYKAAKT